MENPKLGKPLSCDQCHGPPAHSLPSPRNPNSPVYLGNQVRTCGRCHGEYEKTFLESVHGQALIEMGLDVGPVFANCPRHGIYRAVEQRSTLNVARVADTCGTCHRGIKERLLKSVHGTGGVLGGVAARPAPGGKTRRLPSCTNCHEGHDIRLPSSRASARSSPTAAATAMPPCRPCTR